MTAYFVFVCLLILSAFEYQLENLTQEFSPYTRWVASTVTATWEQSSVGVMLGSSIGGYQNLAYIEPSLHSIDGECSYVHSTDLFPQIPCYRMGIGAGYRHLISPRWMLGGYIYYDRNVDFLYRYITHENGLNSIFNHALCRLHHALCRLHTVNVGIENRFPWGEFIINGYWNYESHDTSSHNIITIGWLTHIQISLRDLH